MIKRLLVGRVSMLVYRQRFGVRCLVLHPVAYPNKGPVVEQYLAEEAIGLAKSLGWGIIEGPFWGKQVEPSAEATTEPILQQFELNRKKTGGRIRDGEYIFDPSFGHGTYYKGGIIFDINESQSDGDLYVQWQNKLLRSSLANKSLVKTKRITQKLYFTRGKAELIGEHIRKNNVRCLFINAELTPGQIRNLKKLFEAKLNDIAPPVGFNVDTNESETEYESDQQTEAKKRIAPRDFKSIKIFDRFSIILQIFAKRATTPAAKLQIELNFLSYLKTKLMRAEGSTYSSAHNLFQGDLMRAEEINLEIVSARQRRAHAAMSGGGQSQLELEKRQIKDKQAKIRKQLAEQKTIRDAANKRKKFGEKGMPVIALVGYTNAGKSATMNCLLKKKEVESKDLLFQTLNTTAREIILPKGSRARLLDTIGFISNLPHELVESFRTTLEEVEGADLVLHIIDISHPNYAMQRQTVLRVLEQLGFGQKFSAGRMLQVWNKIDLLTPQQQQTLLNESDSKYYVSVTNGTGVKKLMDKVEQLSDKVMNRGTYTFKYSIQDHYSRVQWLKANVNIPNNLDEVFDYTPSSQFPNGSVEYTLKLDSASYGKLMKYINEKPVVRRTGKGMPPPGWSTTNNDKL